MISEQIPWGLKSAVPVDAELAWGARAILRDGYVDIVGDRQGFVGPSEEAIKSFSKIVQDALPLVKKRVLSLWDSRALDPGFSENHILFNSEQLHIVGSTKASHGYFYLAAWKK